MHPPRNWSGRESRPHRLQGSGAQGQALGRMILLEHCGAGSTPALAKHHEMHHWLILAELSAGQCKTNCHATAVAGDEPACLLAAQPQEQPEIGDVQRKSLSRQDKVRCRAVSGSLRVSLVEAVPRGAQSPFGSGRTGSTALLPLQCLPPGLPGGRMRREGRVKNSMESSETP